MTQQKRHVFFVDRLRDYQDSERLTDLLQAYYVYRRYCESVVCACVFIGGLLVWLNSTGRIRWPSPRDNPGFVICAWVAYALLSYRVWVWLTLRERMHLAITGPELEILEKEDPGFENPASIQGWFHLKSHSSIYGRQR